MERKFQLKNGLKVLLVENRKSPVVSIQMWVHTGSADEPKGLEGISHFIEHLVFKGTRSFNVGEIASLVEGSGGELNAYTSFDETVFYVTISKHFDHIGLKVISEMMGHPLFLPEEIDNEREVVIEEIKRGNDSLYRQSSQMLFSTLYTKHPYGLPVIGYEENIRKVTAQQIQDYFRSRYSPANMTLVIVGDFSFADMKKKVQEHFSDFLPSRVKSVRRAAEPLKKAAKISAHKAAFEETLVHWAWPIPSVKHRDIPALDVLSMIIGQGESSWLNRALRLNKHLVNFIGASTFTPKDSGFFSISSSLQIEQLEAAGQEVLAVLQKALHEKPTEEELQRAKVNIQSEEFYALETVDGMARKYGNYEQLFGDFKYMKVFLKQVLDLKPEDIQKVARKYLKPELVRISLMTSRDIEAPQQILKNWTRQLKKAYQPAKAKKPVTKIKSLSSRGRNQVIVKTLSNGIRVLFRPSYETEVVSLRSALLGGVRIEDEATQGVCELTANTWVSGTASLSEEQIHGQVESMASSLTAFSGRNTMGLSMTTLNSFSKPMRDLFVDCLLNPVFPKRSVDREKASMLEQLRTRQDNPAQVCILNFMKTFFKGHPYAQDPHGTVESVGSLESDHLKAIHERVLGSKNLSMAVTGYVDVEEWEDYLNRALSGMNSGERIESEFDRPLFEKEERVFAPSDKEQSHIVIGFPGLTFTSPERHALQLIQSILAGQGGRLFLELRDKASLAYTVAPLKMEGIDTGYFGAYIACSPEKAKKAISMLRQEFDRLTQEKVSPSEIQRSVRYLIGRHDIDLQKTSSVSAAILFDDIYGLPADETFHFAKRLNSVTAEDIQTLAQKIFSQPGTLSVVGPQCPW